MRSFSQSAPESASASEDDELVQRSKDGDESALTLLITRYSPLVRLRAHSFSKGAIDCEDLYQEGMVALLKAVRHYREDVSGSFKTFALVCINNKLRSAIIAHMRGKNGPMRDYLSLSDVPDNADWLMTAPDKADPETLVIASEQADTRRRQIDSLLSPFERQVLQFYLSSYSYEEMAARLGATAKAVDNALQRVRRKLRSVFINE